MDNTESKTFNSLDRKMSLWEVVHRWTGHEVVDLSYGYIDGPFADEIVDAGISLMSAQLAGDLRIFHKSGYEVFEKGNLVTVDGVDTYPLEKELWQCGAMAYQYHDESVKGHFIDSRHLDSVLLQIDDLGIWALKQGLPFPDFCLTQFQKELLQKQLEANKSESASTLKKTKLNQDDADQFWHRLSNSQRSRLITRHIATELWKSDETRTIADIQRHPIVQEYCGAKHYSDKDTIRNWIKDLDPRDVSSKVGRPSKKK